MIPRRQLLGALATAPWFSAVARAQSPAGDYPNRPVRVVVAFAPGSQTDSLVRNLSPRLSQLLGAPIVVENRPGATGIIGTQYVAKAAPDGYTLVMGGVSSHGTLAALMPNLPYDVRRDFVPIGLATAPPAIIAVHPSVPANNLQEFIAWSRQQPSGVSYSSSGNGSSGHLTAELLTIKTGAKLVQVPYKDVGQAITDLLSGQVKMMIYYSPLLPHIQAKRLKALAVLSDRRLESAPEIPTGAQQGFPQLLSTGWTGLFGPAGLPDPIRDKIQAALAQTLEDPAIREKLAQQGQVPMPLGPAAFGRWVEAEIEKWSEVVKVAGVKV